MKRRDFIAAFGAAAVWPFTARAQERERVRTLGVIMAYAEHDPEGQARLSVLRQQLQKLGWAEGRNIRIEVRWAAGRPDLMQTYGRELVGLPADVLIGNSTPLLTVMRQLTRTIPIVFTQVADPVASGFVSNYARPDGNITGFTGLDATIAGKWLEVLKEAVPSVQRATVLLNPDQANYPAFVQAIESAASALKIPVSAAAARDGAGIEQAITGLAGQTDRGLIILPGPVNHTQRGSIIGLAAKYRLPAIYPLRYYAKEGGLLHYGVDQADQWTKAAGYVDRILRGEKPSDLPVQAATKFELAINLSTAKALGLEVPPTVLARADEVIE